MKRHRPLRSPPSQTTTTTTISSYFPSKKPKPISSNLKTPLKWTPLNLPKSELYLPLTFPTGQTFRWKQTSPFQYTGVIGSHLISLKQHNLKNTHYCIHNLTTNDDQQESVKLALLDFLNMGISLNDLWTEFSASDERFAELAVNLSGARVLRQDPLECLVQFICSSNNNIKRITKMVDFVSCLGEFVGVVDGVEFYKFPSLERLASVTEDELREAGFGYRVKCITGIVKVLQSKPGGSVKWLLSLRKLDLESAIKALTTLPGFGPKVAACIALFSLDQHQWVPVDTHV